MLIGISGKIGGGKDTVAKLLADKFNKKIPVFKKSFAFKLKQVVEILSGYKMKTSYDNNFFDGITDFTREDKDVFIKVFNQSIGEMLQIIGTEVFRDNYDKEVWIKSLFNDYNSYEKKNTIWIISDVRFTNEAEYVKSNDGILIRVNGDPLNIANNSNRDINHPSETALDNYSGFDFMIENIGSLEDLEKKVNGVVEKISKKWKKNLIK